METQELTLATLRARVSTAGDKERYELADAYNHITGMQLWKGAYPDVAACVADVFKGKTESELRAWADVVLAFGRPVIDRYGFDKLGLLIAYEDATGGSCDGGSGRTSGGGRARRHAVA